MRRRSGLCGVILLLLMAPLWLPSSGSGRDFDLARVRAWESEDRAARVPPEEDRGDR